MKIVITGGGTGGHLYPALAVADALKSQNAEVEILFVGSERGMEKEAVPEAGHSFQALDVVGFPRRPGLGSIRAAISFARAISAARTLLRSFAPEVVFSTGGYASAAVVAAAWLNKIPIVLQEQNSVPGLTNRIASRMAREVHLAFAGARRYFPRRRHLRLTGNPLRAQVMAGSRQRALRLFRLDEDKLTVLVLGGSQGAHSINEAVLGALPLFSGRTDIQFVIQTGNLDHDRVMDKCNEVEAKTWVRRFISNVGDAYAAADLVVCRAGAMTLSELCACGLPSILIPYPHATANHQWINAEQLSEGGAAVLIADKNLTGQLLHETIESCLADKRRLREMAVNALRMSRPDATAKLVRALGRFLPGFEPPQETAPPYGRPERRGYGSGPGRGAPGDRRPGVGDRRPGGGDRRGPDPRRNDSRGPYPRGPQGGQGFQGGQGSQGGGFPGGQRSSGGGGGGRPQARGADGRGGRGRSRGGSGGGEPRGPRDGERADGAVPASGGAAVTQDAPRKAAEGGAA